MLTCAIAALTLTLQSADCFPLKAGLVWEYEVVIEGTVISAKQRMATQPPVKIGNVEAVPMQVFVDGRLDSTAFYRIHNGYVSLVANDEKEPLPQPVPVLPAQPKVGAKWEFNGSTRILGALAGTKVKSRISTTEQVEVLGKKLTAFKVETEAEIGKGATAMLTKTVELFAPGIGLVYRKQEFKSRQTGSVVTRLVSFEGGGV